MNEPKKKNKHFIKELTVKNYKCFNDFKVTDLSRVNLITGGNNVGKTALMEAIYIYVRAQDVKSLLQALIRVKLARENLNLLVESFVTEKSVNHLAEENVKEQLEANDGIILKSDVNSVEFHIKEQKGIKEYSFKTLTEEFSVNVKDFSFGRKRIENIRFIGNSGMSNIAIINGFAYLQNLDQESYLDNILNKFDNSISAFKVIGKIPSSNFKDKDNHKAILHQIYKIGYPNAPYNFDHQNFDKLKTKLKNLFQPTDN